MLIVFPLGLLATSFIFDIVYRATGDGLWGQVAFYMIVAGIVGGLIAGIFGLIDWLSIPRQTRAFRIGLWHGLGNVTVLTLFLISALLRGDNPAAPGVGAFILSLLGVLLALVTGWLGGELVERLGISVDPGAHVNSPSSLSGKSAGEQAVEAGHPIPVRHV
jgi:uncharacterized membrane protein